MAKCGVCSKTIGGRKLYEHVRAQTGGEAVHATEPDKLSIQLPANPPSTPQEWKALCVQIAQVVETANHMATQLEEVKRQLHNTSEQLQSLSTTPISREGSPLEQPQPQREPIARPPVPARPTKTATRATPMAIPYETQPTPNQTSGTIDPKRTDRKSYLEIAKIKKPQLDVFPEAIREKVSAGKAAMASFVRPQPRRQLQPEAVYLENAQRGPLHKLREALRISLPGEAVLHLDFIGGSLLEVICHKPLVHKLISHVNFMSDGKMRRISFDPLAKPTVSKAKQAKGKELWVVNTRNCLRRIGRILSGNPYAEVRGHFNSVREKAKELLQKLEARNETRAEEEKEEGGWTKVTRKNGTPPVEARSTEAEPNAANES